MNQGLNVEPSSMHFPKAMYMFANGRAIETVVENQAAYDRFVRAYGGGRHPVVLNECRLLITRK